MTPKLTQNEVFLSLCRMEAWHVSKFLHEVTTA